MCRRVDCRKCGKPTYITRIAVIVRSKAAGMSLEQIRALLDGAARERRSVLAIHLEDLDRRMAELRRSRQMTLHALDCHAHDIAACSNFSAGVRDILDGLAPRLSGLAAEADS